MIQSRSSVAMTSIPKGEQIPVENLLQIMERDAETMLDMQKEISRLKAERNVLRQDNDRLRRKLLRVRSGAKVQ